MELEANLKAAYARREGCREARDLLWHKILEHSERGFIQEMVRLRDQADEQGRWLLSLDAKILGWTRELERLQGVRTGFDED